MCFTLFLYCYRTGEAPRAYIVKSENAVITLKDVFEFVASRSASYKHLVGGVEFMEQIPRSLSGKILRKDLRAMYGLCKVWTVIAYCMITGKNFTMSSKFDA